MAARIDLFDPSPEGPFVIEQLRQAGFAVREIVLADVASTRADLLVLAGDADGSIAALKRLRDDDDRGGLPVVLLGIPPGARHPGSGAGFGADAVFERPVPLGPVLGRVRALIEATGSMEASRIEVPRVERTMQLSDPDDPDSSQIVLMHGDDAPSRDRPLREPTFALRDSEVPEAKPRVESEPVPRSSPPEGSPTDAKRPGRARPTSDRVPISSSSTAADRRRAAHDADPGGLSGSSSSVSVIPPSQPGNEPDAPEPRIPPEQRARLSPWLAALLAAADRRTFPDRPPLSLHFPAADEPPDVMVPRDLFEEAPLRFDEAGVEDPIDAFTYVGGPAVPPPVIGPAIEESAADAIRAASPSTHAEARRARPEQTTATEQPGEANEKESDAPGSGVHRAHSNPGMMPVRAGSWPEDDEALGRAGDDDRRSGELEVGGAIRLLFRIATLGLDAICELTLRDGRALRLTFLAGELRVFDGPLAQVALARLRASGRATETPIDEAGAARALARRVEQGELSRFARDRLLREAREELLVDLVRAEGTRFVLSRLEDTEPGRALSRSRALSRPLRAALIVAARAAFDTDRAIELLGGLEVGIALGPTREVALVAAELTSELIGLLVRAEGRPLSEILAEAPVEPALAATVLGLVRASALTVTEARIERPAPETRSAVRAQLAAAAAVARDGDYFRILGVSPGVHDAALRDAYDAQRAELFGLPLALLGLPELEPLRAEALDALDEAFGAIGHAPRRRAYARALGLGGL